ncbi:MAG TPA: ABC transporter ATP-binding protein [Edaphobacter sp.]|nr:ABC transporter ATP-binding protein [Edaphobacter sp.]
MAAVIETVELKKDYGKHEAVRGLNLSVQSGSVCAFLGQNGAGKSSTIKMLLGMVHPTSGTGSIFGHRIDREKESLLIRQKVAFVAEDKRLYDYMTVAQIVRFTKSFFPHWNHDLERRLLEQFELPPERRIRQLSKGMRTKLALLLGFARGCDLLILDEPTEGLDPVAIEDVLQIVVSLAAQGTTVFFSSHQIAEVEQVADHVLMIDRGKLVLDAPMDQVNRMVAAGVFMIAFGNLCYTLFPGNYLSLILTLVLLGAPYLWLQTYMQHMRAMGRPTWLGYLDFAHAMSGPWQLNWATTPWITLLVIWMLTALLLGATAAYGDRVDY